MNVEWVLWVIGRVMWVSELRENAREGAHTICSFVCL